MHSEVKLTEIAIVVVAALMGGISLARLKQPSILGYILAGVILGPSGFALIQSRDQVSSLAELGVLLLLFVVGMELNLKVFKRVWIVATLCTLLQIICSVLITLLLAQFFGWSLGLALLLGFVASISSTAVVFKMIEGIGEMKSEAGQLVVGILIAQDLAIIPMILILRNYGQSWLNPGLIIKLVVAIGLTMALIAYLSRKQRVRFPLGSFFAGEKDLIPLAGLTLCFAAAAISGLIGLSAPYGAFLAGLVLGNTHERVIYLETTKPIQNILLMAFFLSIGLLLDIQFIWQHFWTVLVLLFIVTVGKTALNIGILRALQLSWSQAFLVGTLVAQLGEFAFLMASVSTESHIINQFGENLIIALTVLSLAFSPIWNTTAKRLKDMTNVGAAPLGGIMKFIYASEKSSLKSFFCFFKKNNKSKFTYQIKKTDHYDQES